MPARIEETPRKGALLELRTIARTRMLNSLPASPLVLKQMFDYIERRLQEQDCADNLALVHEFAVRNQLPAPQLIAWLEENGGYCDCEALDNVEELVWDAVPGYEYLGNDQIVD